MDTNETQPQNVQDGIDMTNDELASAMGFMTTLGDQQMQMMQGGEEPEEQPQEESPEQPTEEPTPEEPKEEPIDREQLKAELKDEIKTELIAELLKTNGKND